MLGRSLAHLNFAILSFALSLAVMPIPMASAQDLGPADEDGLILLDDMMIPEAALKAHLRGAVLADLVPWEDGVLPVSFDLGIPPSRQWEFLRACDEWAEVGNVRCIKGEYKGRSIKVGKWTSGCWALWGMGHHFVALRRRINLSDGCWTRRTLLHELGHAFGLIHEHQRADRDDYIEFQEENISKKFLGLNFRVNFSHQEAELITPYDFLSIMHYRKNQFSKNGEDTILVKAPYEDFQDAIGRKSRLSYWDGETMAALYGRPKGPTNRQP